MNALSVAVGYILSKGIKIPLGIFSLFFSIFTVSGQIPGMKVYSQFDGYPATIGYVITQDEKGFIWVGSDKGAICFDGKRFKVIDDRMGLIDKEILTAAPCNDGRVLFTPLLNNISYYQDGIVITPTQDPTLQLIKNKLINHTHIDKVTGKVWLCDEGNNATFFGFHNGSITQFNVKINVNFYTIAVINNRILLQIREGKRDLLWYDIITDKIDTLKVDFNFDSKNAVNIRISDDAKNLLLYNVDKKKIVGYEIKDNNTVKIFENYTQRTLYYAVIDRNNHLWVLSSDNGLEYWGPISKITNKSKPTSLFNDVTINYVFVDNDGNVWFSTVNSGLFFISEKHWQNTLRTMPLQLADLTPSCVTGNEKQIYFGHKFPGISVREGHTTSTINFPKSNLQSIMLIKSLSRGVIVAGRDVILFVQKTKNGGTKVIEHHKRAIKYITNYDDELLLFAAHDGAYVFRESPKTYGFEDEKIYSGRTTTICKAPNDEILIGTPNGLYIKQSLRGEGKLISHPILSKVHITSMAVSRTGYVLIGTSVNGLFVYNSETQSCKPVNNTITEGTGNIRFIHSQNDSTYWLSTDRGAYCISFDADMVDKTVSLFTFFDGLPSNNVVGIHTHNDTIYVATSAGLGVLLPNRKSTTSRQPVVWISSAKYKDSTIQFPQKLTIGPVINDIQLSLSAISYESFGNIKYQYRLLGLTNNWVITESPDISFSGLPPGQYQLQVLALSYNGTKSANAIVLPIIVLPSFWQTWWFKVLVAAALLVILSLLIIRWVQRYKNIHYKQMQQKRKLAELELEAIKAQINPHFVFNCLNSIQVFSYKNEHDLVKQYINLFAKLIRQTMQYSQETFITLGEERDYLTNYLKLEKIRFKEKLNYKLWVDESLSSTTLIPAMLVQPYVENALKHGVTAVKDREGMVEINFYKKEGGGLIITIEDNGPGLPAQATNSSRKTLGMRLSGSRAQAYNQLFNLNVQVNIRANTVLGYGTVIELIIPSIAHEATKF